jgi:nucleotide-binding universal stress UspA family protein
MSGIVVGVDGSSPSRGALVWAIREAAMKNSPLTVLTVHEVAASGWGGLIVYPEDRDLAGQARKAAQEAADQAVHQIGEPKPPEVNVVATSGTPAAVLVEASRDADQLVLGSRGAGGFARLLMGSVSNEVVHHALCPITIVPSERHHD